MILDKSKHHEFCFLLSDFVEDLKNGKINEELEQKLYDFYEKFSFDDFYEIFNATKSNDLQKIVLFYFLISKSKENNIKLVKYLKKSDIKMILNSITQELKSLDFSNDSYDVEISIFSEIIIFLQTQKIEIEKEILYKFIDEITEIYNNKNKSFILLKYIFAPILLTTDNEIFKKLSKIFGAEELITSIFTIKELTDEKIFENLIKFFGDFKIRIGLDIALKKSYTTELINYLINHPHLICKYQDMLVPIIVGFCVNEVYFYENLKQKILSCIYPFFDQLNIRNKLYIFLTNLIDYNSIDINLQNYLHIINELENLIDKNKLTLPNLRKIQKNKLNFIKLLNKEKIKKLSDTYFQDLIDFLILITKSRIDISSNTYKLLNLTKIADELNISFEYVFRNTGIKINEILSEFELRENFFEELSKNLKNPEKFLEFLFENSKKDTNTKIKYVILYSYFTNKINNILDEISIDDIVLFLRNNFIPSYISKKICIQIILKLKNKNNLTENEIKFLLLFFNQIEPILGFDCLIDIIDKIKNKIDDVIFSELFLSKIKQIKKLNEIYNHPKINKLYIELINNCYKMIKNDLENESIYNKSSKFYKIVENLITNFPNYLDKGIDNQTYEKIKFLSIYYQSVNSNEKLFFKYILRNFENLKEFLKYFQLSTILNEDIINIIIEEMLNPRFNNNLKKYMFENPSILEILKYIKNIDLRNKIILKCIIAFSFSINKNSEISIDSTSNDRINSIILYIRSMVFHYRDVGTPFNIYTINYYKLIDILINNLNSYKDSTIIPPILNPEDILENLLYNYTDFLFFISKKYKIFLKFEYIEEIVTQILIKLMSSKYLFYKNKNLIEDVVRSLIFYGSLKNLNTLIVFKKYFEYTGITEESVTALFLALRNISSDSNVLNSLERELDLNIEDLQYMILNYLVENIDRFGNREFVKSEIKFLISYYENIKENLSKDKLILYVNKIEKLFVNNIKKVYPEIFSDVFPNNLFKKIIENIFDDYEILLELIYNIISGNITNIWIEFDEYKLNCFFEKIETNPKLRIVSPLFKILRNPLFIERISRNNYNFRFNLNKRNNELRLDIHINYINNTVKFSILSLIQLYARKNIEKLTGQKIYKIRDIEKIASKHSFIFKDPLTILAYSYSFKDKILNKTTISIIISNKNIDILIDNHSVSSLFKSLAINYREFFEILATYISPVIERINQYIIDNIIHVINITKGPYDYEKIDNDTITSIISSIIRLRMNTHLNYISLTVVPIYGYYLQFIVPNTNVCYCIVNKPKTTNNDSEVVMNVRPNEIGEHFTNAEVVRIIKITKSRKGLSFSIVKSLDELQKDLKQLKEKGKIEDTLASLKLKQMGITI